MIAVLHFEPSFATCLPETLAILLSGGLVLHPAVARVTLHGSRGLAGNYRPDSDLDLSLLVPGSEPPTIDAALDNHLKAVIETTLRGWKGPVELDLAAVFPLWPCGLVCFARSAYDPAACPSGGVDCFGIYKLQKGFSGFLWGAGIRVERIYPCITIWKSPE